jgi:signal transduction histidine kinase
MVAGIGHEIANPIGLISMSAENFRHSADKLEQTLMPVFTGSEEAEMVGKKIKAIIDELRDVNECTTIGSNRLKDLSMALRTQSRMDLEATPGVNLNEVVKEAMLITGGRTKVHRVTDSLGELPALSCYRSKIGQVLTNLLANAADALTEKVESTRAVGGEAFKGQIFVVSKSWDREGMPGVLVTISDNGDGVPEAIREKIFDQFFTTKPAGVGTGLGLAMCVDIVKEHGGMLTVSDDADLGGARFELWLPLEVEAPEVSVVDT